MPGQQRLVQPTIGSIHALDGVAFRPVQLIEIHFLQVGLQQLARFAHPVLIVLVGRIGTPVAGGGVDLNADQPLAGESGRHDAVDLAGGVATAADLHRHLFRPDQSGGVVLVCPAPGVGQMQVVRAGLQLQLGVPRQIQRVGHPVENVPAVPDRIPGTAGAAGRAQASEHHNPILVLAGLQLPGLAVFHAPGGKMQMLPARLARGDPDGLAGRGTRVTEKFGSRHGVSST